MPESLLFCAGDRVVLFAGTQVGSPGTFVALRPDRSWGDIRDPNGKVAPHPMQWVRHWREGAELPTTVAAMQSDK